jgi:hypothetical protein
MTRSPGWSILPSKNGAFASPLEFDLGDRWQYGIGMDVVGKIIEAASALRWVAENKSN